VLREAGIEVGPGRLADALAALDQVELARRDDVYWTLRQTLVAKHAELEAFDRAFAAWFERTPTMLLSRETAEPPQLRLVVAKPTEREPEAAEEREDTLDSGGWSPEEVLRQKDFATLTSDELATVRRSIARLAAERPVRKTRRLRRHRRGRKLDLRGLVRNSLATGGDPLDRVFRERSTAPRKLAVLCDISHSMEPYARALLLFVHAVIASGRGAEAFAFGTRLTRLTPDLRGVDPDRAIAHATSRVVDWSGGTRIGASLKQFNDEWGRRALSRGAVVVIVSDGWEREDSDLVGREMARLARAAYAVVWVNPLKGHPGYQPLAGGMRAALPYVDRFVSGQNLSDLEELAEVLAGIERRHAA
jgi:uncharacterized protein with von Willebrand factor type A (vWA) domain